MAESRFAELKEKEKEARKQILIESALALFAKKPFFEVGMREVADEAGISPATIYRYFSSQEELFNEAFIQDISSVSKEFKSMVLKDKPVSIEEFGIKFVDRFHYVLLIILSIFNISPHILVTKNQKPNILILLALTKVCTICEFEIAVV